MELGHHAIADGEIQLVQAINPCFYWVRCQLCHSLQSVHSLIDSYQPVPVDRLTLGDKVVIKHMDSVSYCVRWDRAVIRGVDDREPRAQQVEVYLPDTMKTMTLNFSSVYVIEKSQWDSFKTMHIIGLRGGVPMRGRDSRSHQDYDADLTSNILKSVDTTIGDRKTMVFSWSEKRKYSSIFIVFGDVKVTTSTGMAFDLLAHLVRVKLMVDLDERWFEVLEEEGWLESIAEIIRNIHKMVKPDQEKQLKKVVNVLPPPPIKVNHARMAELREIRFSHENKIEDLVLPNIRTESHEEFNERMRQSAATSETNGSISPNPNPNPGMGRGMLLKFIMEKDTSSGSASGLYSNGHNQGHQETSGQFDEAESPGSKTGVHKTFGRDKGTDGSVGQNLKSTLTTPSGILIQRQTTSPTLTTPSGILIQRQTTSPLNSIVIGRGEILKCAKKSPSSVPLGSLAGAQETEGQFDDAEHTGSMINDAYDCPDGMFGDPAIVEIEKSNVVYQRRGEVTEDPPAASGQKRLVKIDSNRGTPIYQDPAFQCNLGGFSRGKLIAAKQFSTCIPRTAGRLGLHDSKALPAAEFLEPKNPNPVLNINIESGAAKRKHIYSGDAEKVSPNSPNTSGTSVLAGLPGWEPGKSVSEIPVPESDNVRSVGSGKLMIDSESGTTVSQNPAPNASMGGFARGKLFETKRVPTCVPRTAGKLGLPDNASLPTVGSPGSKSPSSVLSINKERSPDLPNTSGKSILAGSSGSEPAAISLGSIPTADSFPSHGQKSPSPVSKNFKGSPSSNPMFDSNKLLHKMEPTFESQVNVPASPKTSSTSKVAGRNDSHQKGINNSVQSQSRADGASGMPRQGNLPDRLFASEGGVVVAMQSLKTQKGLIFGEGSSDIRVYDYLGDFDLHANIRENARGLMNLTRPQSLVMPAILNRRDVMIVGPNKSKKTSAILVPLMSLLLENSYYSVLRPGSGPRCIIFAPTSERVMAIGQLCKQYGGRDIETVFTHGGGLEKERVFELTAGCDILVTTPRCWLRLMSFIYVTDMRRLCHLVLDRFDVLQELFPSELHEIVGRTRALLSVRSQKGKGWELLGVQVVVSCEKWTPEKKVFVEKVLHKPILVFTSFLECAVLSRVSHGMFIVKSRDKPQKLTQLIEKFPMKTIAVGCNCAEDVFVAKEAVYSSNRHMSLVVAHEKMSNVLMTQISSEWKLKQHPVLVFSDRVVTDFNVTDADVLIHFSIPASKSSFSDRYVTIRDAMVRRALNPNDTSQSKGFIIVDDGEPTAEIPFPFIVDFLKRLNVEISPAIENCVKEIKLHKEESKDVLFCKNILQTGRCFEEDRCKWRHVLRETDQADLDFTQGLVKVNISHIHSAVKFSVRILEYNPDPYGKGPWIQYKTNYQAILQSMSDFFGKRTNRRLQGWVRTGDLVAYLEDGETSFHRARVINVVERNHLKEPKVVRILAVDFGYEVNNASVSSLFELPEDLKNYPDQSEYLYLANLKPIDLDTSWSVAACSTVEDAIASKEGEMEKGDKILGRLLFRFGNNAIVDNLRWVKHLKHSTLHALDLRHTILTSKSGLDNPEYSTKMIELFKQANLDYCVLKNIPVPKIEEKKKPPTWAHLPGDDEYTSVIIVDVESPARFYVKVSKFDDAVISLQRDIAAAAVSGRETPLLNPSVGDICTWKSPLDSCDETNRWNRCLIQDIQNEMAIVLMVDYGDFENVPVSQLFKIPWEFVTKLPFQAIECSLAGVKPSIVSDDDWCEEAVDEFNRLTAGDIEKNFYVKVLNSEKNAQRTCGRRYTVVVVDLDDGGCVVNEKFSFGIHTIADFGVDLDELKKVYQDHLLANQDDPPADVDEADDWNTPYVPPTKPNRPAGNGRNGSTESIHMNLDELSDGEVDAMADAFLENKTNLEQILATLGISLPKKEPKELKMIEAGPSNAALTNGVALPGEDHRTKPASQESPETANVCAGLAQDRFRRPDSSVAAQGRSRKPDADTNCNLSAGTTELADCPPPPLLESCDKNPKVTWLQDDETVTIRFMIPCLQNYELEVRDSSIIFLGSVPNGLGGKDIYGRIIEFFGSIDAMFEEIEGPSYLSVKLVKLQPGNWSRLTYHEAVDRTIVYDAGGSNCDEDACGYIHEYLEHGLQMHLKRKFNPEEFYEDEDLGVGPDYLVPRPEGIEEADEDLIEGPDLKPSIVEHEELDL